MICSIVSTSLMLHCTSCKAWLPAKEFEEHAFGHHVRNELPYAIDEAACRIYMIIKAGSELRGEILDLWDTRQQVDEDCAKMKLRNSVRFDEGLRLAAEAAKQRALKLTRELASNIHGKGRTRHEDAG